MRLGHRLGISAQHRRLGHEGDYVLGARLISTEEQSKCMQETQRLMGATDGDRGGTGRRQKGKQDRWGHGAQRSTIKHL